MVGEGCSLAEAQGRRASASRLATAAGAWKKRMLLVKGHTRAWLWFWAYATALGRSGGERGEQSGLRGSR